MLSDVILRVIKLRVVASQLFDSAKIPKSFKASQIRLIEHLSRESIENTIVNIVHHLSKTFFLYPEFKLRTLKYHLPCPSHRVLRAGSMLANGAVIQLSFQL
jgi:hypothetical protein